MKSGKMGRGYIFMAAGLTVLIVGVVARALKLWDTGTFYVIGLGCGMTAVAAVHFLVRTFRPRWARRSDAAASDERGALLRGKASYAALISNLIVSAALGGIFAALKMELAMFLAGGALALNVLVYLVAAAALDRRM
jgi:hypothetical protein